MNIMTFQGENRWLSNFARVIIKYNGLQFASVEAAYQAAKSNDIKVQRSFTTVSASKAKQKGRKITLREDWEAIKLDVMEDMLRQKFNQEPYKTKLMKTFDGHIEEGNWWNDTFWGVCRGKGHNNLGKLIMQIRGELYDQHLREDLQ